MLQQLATYTSSRKRALTIDGYQSRLDSLTNDVQHYQQQRDSLSDIQLTYGVEVVSLQMLADSLSIEEKTLETRLDSVTVKLSVDEISMKADELRQLLPDARQRLTAVVDSLESWLSNVEKLMAEIASSTSRANVLFAEVNEVYTGIPSLTIKEADIQRYDLQGRPVDEHYHGVIVIRQQDGTTRVVYQK